MLKNEKSKNYNLIKENMNDEEKEDILNYITTYLELLIDDENDENNNNSNENNNNSENNQNNNNNENNQNNNEINNENNDKIIDDKSLTLDKLFSEIQKRDNNYIYLQKYIEISNKIMDDDDDIEKEIDDNRKKRVEEKLNKIKNYDFKKVDLLIEEFKNKEKEPNNYKFEKLIYKNKYLEYEQIFKEFKQYIEENNKKCGDIEKKIEHDSINIKNNNI